MPDFFRRAHHFVVEGGKYIAVGRDKVKNTFNITINIGTQGASLHPNIEHDEDQPQSHSFVYYLPISRVYWSFPSFAILYVAFRLSRVRHTPATTFTPSAPTIFYGRDELVDSIVQQILIGQKSGRGHITIRGGPGLGKTSIALAVINDKRIVKRFRNERHWVSCDEVSTIPQLLEEISAALDPAMPKSNNRRRDIIFYLHQSDVPHIVGLDNFETIWGPVDTRAQSEDILVALVPHLTIILTTRGPSPAVGRIQWCDLDPIEPLSLRAARQTFTSIRSRHIDDRLDDLLRAVDCVPLTVVLLASYGQRGFTTSKLLEIWNEKHTRFLDDGEGRLSNLDMSIRASLDSPLMNDHPDALILLTIVAYLPGGVIYDHMEEIAAKIVVAPLSDTHKAAKTLIDTALVQHTGGVLRVLSTIRSYVRHYHPLSPPLKAGLQTFYFQLAEKAGHDQGTKNFSESARQALSQEQRNAEAIILDALKYRLDADTILASIHFSNHLIWNIPSLEVPRRAVEAIRNSSSPATESLLPLCWLRLGKLHIKLDEYDQAINATQEAEKGYKQLNQLEGVAKSHYQLAEVNQIRGEHDQAAYLFTQAYEEFQVSGSFRDMASCLRGLGIVHFANDKYPEAVQAIMNARDICVPGDDTCLTDCKRELGRVYRKHNTTEAIKLLTEARAYYLLHGPLVHAAHCLYQKSIAHYRQKDYSQAERGLIEAYQDFKHLGNYAQMGYCIYHRAMLNSKRGFFLKALALFEQSRLMFEQMENPLMDTFSIVGKARIYAVLCRAGKAHNAYKQVLEELEKLGKDVTRFKWEMERISSMCGLQIGWSYLIRQWYVWTITIVLFCWVLFLLRWRCRWHLR